MPQTAKGSALVAGSRNRDESDDTKTIEALRGFMCNGQVVVTGAVITVPARLARELIASNKAVVLAAPDEPDTPDEDTETTDETAPRRRGRPPKAKELI